MKLNERALRADANNFTLVRAFLACTVIYSHAFWATTGLDGTDEAAPILGASLGSCAVEAFFFLSGFLVYASLQRMVDARRFVLARLARLWPGLAACIVVTVLGGWMFSDVHGWGYFSGDTSRYLFDNLTFLKGFYTLTGVRCGVALCNVDGSLWSLPWEVRCYAILAVLAAVGLAAPQRLARVILPLTLAFAVAWDVPWLRERATATLGPAAEFQIDVLHRLWPLFALGIAAFIFRTQLRLSWLVLLGLLLANFLLQDTAVGLQVRAIFIGYGVLCLGFLTAKGRSVSGAWPDYSYGIYIYAFPIMDLVHGRWAAWPHLALAAATLVCTIPVAAVSWHLIEKPAIDSLRKVALFRRSVPASDAADRSRELAAPNLPARDSG